MSARRLPSSVVLSSCHLLDVRLPDFPLPTASRVGGARGGLASRGVAPTVLSGAALGHDRVRDGTGWGQHALGHGHPPPPNPGGRSRTARHGRAARPVRLRHPPRAGSLPTRLLSGRPRALHAPLSHTPGPRCDAVRAAPPVRETRREASHNPPVVGAPPSGAGRPGPSAAPQRRPKRESYETWRGIRPRPLGRLGSSRLPAVHLPPINPVICRGSFLLAERGCSSWGGIPA